ncbi:hypothetical protein U0070_008237 [Myodes glareolus]|uniref:Uncharacterized protein n=1 Tax=Myodes glareolus TaxID=447135 RepID=A0AAW0I861_MYOGA
MKPFCKLEITLVLTPQTSTVTYQHGYTRRTVFSPISPHQLSTSQNREAVKIAAPHEDNVCLHNLICTLDNIVAILSEAESQAESTELQVCTFFSASLSIRKEKVVVVQRIRLLFLVRAEDCDLGRFRVIFRWSGSVHPAENEEPVCQILFPIPTEQRSLKQQDSKEEENKDMSHRTTSGERDSPEVHSADMQSSVMSQRKCFQMKEELKRVKQCYDVRLFAKRDEVYGLTSCGISLHLSGSRYNRKTVKIMYVDTSAGAHGGRDNRFWIPLTLELQKYLEASVDAETENSEGGPLI